MHNYFFFPSTEPDVFIFIISLQALERCQLKDIVASKPEKLDALGLLFFEHIAFLCVFFYQRVIVPELGTCRFKNRIHEHI